MHNSPSPTPPKFPRITIEYCTQCKWMLRAAWLAQELLSTFSLSIGEIALQPSTGGTYTLHLIHVSTAGTLKKDLLWDRKAEGGFPEAKEIKRRVRDIIDPKRDLGHVDGHKQSTTTTTATTTTIALLPTPQAQLNSELCNDCT